ncbi:MAG: HAD family hydrolase [Janthinobacterium lividum]
MIKGIIFDSDGTLVDSETLSAQVVVELLRERGIDIDYEEALQRFRGSEFAKFAGRLAVDRGLTGIPEFTVEFRERSRARYAQELLPMPGALELVSTLTLPKCVASNGPRDKLDTCLGASGLAPYFDGLVFSAYEVGSWKPAPGLILHAAQAIGVAPGDCLLVEDSVAGIEAGLAAGVQIVGYRLEPDVLARLSQPVRVIDDLLDVRDLIAG